MLMVPRPLHQHLLGYRHVQVVGADSVAHGVGDGRGKLIWRHLGKPRAVRPSSPIRTNVPCRGSAQWRGHRDGDSAQPRPRMTYTSV